MFYLAAQTGCLELMEMIYNLRIINVNAESKMGTTALWIAAHNGHLAAVRYLVEECRVDISVQDQVVSVVLTTSCQCQN